MCIRTAFFVVLLFAGMVDGTVQGQAPAASYATVLSGSIGPPLCTSAGVASGDAAGDLAGSFTVNFDCNDTDIAGGEWRIVVKGAGPEGPDSELGTLSGRVVKGSYQTDADGGILTASAVEVAVTEGTGAYASVTTGNGTLEVIANPNASPQFQGTLRLTF